MHTLSAHLFIKYCKKTGKKSYIIYNSCKDELVRYMCEQSLLYEYPVEFDGVIIEKWKHHRY
jgi:hypothetical protein